MPVDRGPLLVALRDGLPRATSSTRGIATESLLNTLATSAGPWTREQTDLLDGLGKKIEVTGRLYQAYAPGLGRPLTRKPLQPGYALLLCGLYLDRAQSHHDMKALNTALKMLDGKLTRPKPNYPPEFRDWADDLLAQIAQTSAT